LLGLSPKRIRVPTKKAHRLPKANRPHRLKKRQLIPKWQGQVRLQPVGIQPAQAQHLDITNEEAEVQVLALDGVMVVSDVGNRAITLANVRKTCRQMRKMPRIVGGEMVRGTVEASFKDAPIKCFLDT